MKTLLMISTRINILLLLVIVSYCSCGQAATGKENKANPADTVAPARYIIDTNIVVILPVKSNDWNFRNAKEATLTDKEWIVVERVFMNFIKDHNTKQDTTKRFSEYINLKKYKRQYVPYTDAAGKRKVYINCFCDMSWFKDTWRKSLVEVDDGGACFFQLTVDIEQLKVISFSVNGVA